MQNVTENQKNLLIGGLLGDLYIQKTSSLTNTCRVRVCHSIKQKEFVDWKYSIFKEKNNFCENTKPPYIDKRITKDGKIKNDYYILYKI